MSIRIPRGTSDAVIDEIISALRRYENDHPHARIDLYRMNNVSVRIRIIDPDFTGQTRAERSQATWKYLENLSEDAHGDISTLLLLTPDEIAKSFANFEFDDPIPSML